MNEFLWSGVTKWKACIDRLWAEVMYFGGRLGLEGFCPQVTSGGVFLFPDTRKMPGATADRRIALQKRWGHRPVSFKEFMAMEGGLKS